MVELKNIMEDIVFDLIDSLDEAKSGELSKTQKKEIAAYALNRIKPMYITSNKGFTNLIVKYQNDPQFLADIMVYLSAALKVVRKSYTGNEKAQKLDLTRPHYQLPKIYGKVISSRDMMPLSGATITLLIDGALARNYFELWKNPTEILERDEGIFSFAPMPIEASSSFEKKTFNIRLVVEKGGKRHDKLIAIEAVPMIIDMPDSNPHENVLQLEDIYVPF